MTAAVNGSSTATISYDYDALGRRVKKTVGSTVTQYLLDGDEEIAELNSTGTVLRRYITGPAIDDRIARAEGSAISNPTKTYYRTNHQGSVVATTDATGAVTQRLAYDEYGLLGQGGVSSGEQFRYTGRRYDPETNLYYYRARYYAPDIGRFLQVDPIGYKDDFNLYAYVGNDPANKTDPTGLYAGIDDLIFAGSGALIGVAAQGLSDLIGGSVSSWQDYTAAAVGGAVGGEAALYTLASGPGALVAAGAAAGAATNLTKQTLHKLTDTPNAKFDADGVVKDTAIGAATALIPGAKVAGVTAGRGSMSATAKQIATKFQRGQISSVSTKTATKMATATAVEAATGTTVAAGQAGIEGRMTQSPSPPPKPICVQTTMQLCQ